MDIGGQRFHADQPQVPAVPGGKQADRSRPLFVPVGHATLFAAATWPVNGQPHLDLGSGHVDVIMRDPVVANSRRAWKAAAAANPFPAATSVS